MYNGSPEITGWTVTFSKLSKNKNIFFLKNKNQKKIQKIQKKCYKKNRKRKFKTKQNK